MIWWPWSVRADPQDPTKIERYGVGDMVRVADLVITTSVLEGFGFAYLEPWILDRAVIGRSIPFITPDFQSQRNEAWPSL